MRIKTLYVDEISECEYTSKTKALAAEKTSKKIKEMFSFVKVARRHSCTFANGEYCVQRDEGYYGEFRRVLIDAVMKFDSDSCLENSFFPYGYICHYLREGGNAVTYKYFCVWQRICPKCFREWGHQYHAFHCQCNGEAAEFGLS